MYVYNVCGLLLAFPRLDINLDSTTACLFYSNLRVVLVDNSPPVFNLLFLSSVQGTMEKTGLIGFCPSTPTFYARGVRGTLEKTGHSIQSPRGEPKGPRLFYSNNTVGSVGFKSTW